MGQTVSSIVSQLDGQEEKKKQANDALNALMVMAEDKAALHYHSVNNDAMDAKLLPVHRVISRFQQINCKVSQTKPDQLKDYISKSLNNYVKGEIIVGLAAVASSALDSLMGNVSANKSQVKNYAVTVGSLGGISRIDFFMFYYKYYSKALTDVAEDCLITSLVISSVDVKDLTPNDVKVIVETNYAAQLPNESAEEAHQRQKKIADLVMEQIPKPL